MDLICKEYCLLKVQKRHKNRWMSIVGVILFHQQQKNSEIPSEMLLESIQKIGVVLPAAEPVHCRYQAGTPLPERVALLRATERNC